jgi:hypothetical protein
MAFGNQATQDFIPIKEVRDGVVVLDDNTLRSILLVSSLNISLKSEDEQRATIMQFQNFLNSLDFSVQISAQSRRLDIRPYINTLNERLREQEEELLRVQTREYIGFIQWFNESVNIMSKNFFVVIPYEYAPLTPQNQAGFFGKIASFLGGGSKKKDSSKEMTAFEEQRSQLEQRVSIVQQGLSSVGLKAVELGTQEVIEMYYNMFNPGETQRSVPQQQS